MIMKEEKDEVRRDKDAQRLILIEAFKSLFFNRRLIKSRLPETCTDQNRGKGPPGRTRSPVSSLPDRRATVFNTRGLLYKVDYQYLNKKQQTNFNIIKFLQS
jgi:hypothetical protein